MVDDARLGTPQAPTFGLDTFGDLERDADGTPIHHAVALRQVVEEAALAEEVGLDFFGVGEHHRPDFSISAPDVLLAAIAGRTRRIRLGTSVTVLSSEEPVRVFERFATLDAVSNGRAEITAGRGSFTESFPLFGLSLEDYEVLFSEKLELLSALLDETPVSWQGSTRPPLDDMELFPKTEHGLTLWVGVGGTPESVVRAASYGLPLVVAVIGGSPERFAPLVELYHRALDALRAPDQAGVDAQPGARGGHRRRGPRADVPPPGGVVHPDRPRARLGSLHARAVRGERRPDRSLFVGSPETVAQKIAWAMRTLGLSRFQLKYAVGGLPHDQRMESIRLYGTRVVPRVRELLGVEPADF